MVSKTLEISSLPKGRKWELDVLGYCPIEFSREMYYWEFTSYLWNAISDQPEGYDPRLGYDPNDPLKCMTGQLFDGVRRHIPGRWREFLRLYIALGTGLDRVHGVDALFFLNDTYVTMDATLDMSKRKGADFLLTPQNIDIEKNIISETLVHSIAKRLVHRYELKLAH